MTNLPPKRNLIGLVGPCSAGKSTLIRNLQRKGYICRHIAQEHSYVPQMWHKIVNPLVLIYLDVSYEVSIQRRPLNLTPAEFDEQKKRLRHAYQNADIYLFTDPLSPEEVFSKVLATLEDQDVQPQL
jgi:ABC-type cobalamin/Fe3+-siderophores transport system ATPase subunit